MVMVTGSITALITPFKDGKIDAAAFQSLCDWQVQEGSSGVVPCGTTGESPTLSPEEHERLIDLCVDAVGGRIKVIPGTGSNSTAEAIHFTAYAKKAGADAALVVTPYYNKPTQEGLYQHFKAINDAVDLPILIYNIPGRSVVDMSGETMARLAKLPNIAGVKDATADLARPVRTRLDCGTDFCQLTGDDPTVVAFLAQGGHGCISVTSNVAPRLCADLQAAWQTHNWDEVQRLRDLLAPLNHALFLETNPAPVKYAASLLGRCENTLRLPLVPVSEDTRCMVEAALRHVHLLA